MLLAIDIGNSNVVAGGYREGEWIFQWRLKTEPAKGMEAYAKAFEELQKKARISYRDYTQVIISSVVPKLTETIQNIFERETSLQPIILSESTDTGISLGASDPSGVGADLIADAAGAYHLFGESCIIVDFGTATTVMVVKEPGILAGGAICAGLELTRSALVEKTALLSSIPLELPPDVIGTNTTEAMQSGIMLGQISMVEGLIGRMKESLGDADVKVIATGGLAATLAERTDCFDAVDPLLTLNGLRIIAERQ